VSNQERIHLFTGNSNRQLAQEVATFLGIELGEMEVSRFADGEISVRCGESVRGLDVFVLQPTSPPVNENLMELFNHDRCLEKGFSKKHNRHCSLLRLCSSGSKNSSSRTHYSKACR